MHVVKNAFINEDGILGYDVIGEKAVIHGPNKTITIKSSQSQIEFPLRQHNNNTSINLITEELHELQQFQNIEYLNNNEINPQYEINLKRVQSITQQINPNKIKINQL